MFIIGDNAIATRKITRVDGKSIVYPGERVEITNVWHGKNYTIVSIQPHKGGHPLIDICCDIGGPLELSR